MFDWISDVLEASGLAGVALSMLLENVFPPIPSELIMPLAGFNAARGRYAPVPVLLAGTAGSLAGAYLWYELGRRLGRERVLRFSRRRGRWLTLTPEDIERAEA